MSLMMNGFERGLASLLREQEDMSKREAEAAIREIREGLYDDQYQMIKPVWVCGNGSNSSPKKKWPDKNALIAAYYSGDYSSFTDPNQEVKSRQRHTVAELPHNFPEKDVYKNINPDVSWKEIKFLNVKALEDFYDFCEEYGIRTKASLEEMLTIGGYPYAPVKHQIFFTEIYLNGADAIAAYEHFIPKGAKFME